MGPVTQRTHRLGQRVNVLAWWLHFVGLLLPIRNSGLLLGGLFVAFAPLLLQLKRSFGRIIEVEVEVFRYVCCALDVAAKDPYEQKMNNLSLMMSVKISEPQGLICSKVFLSHKG